MIITGPAETTVRALIDSAAADVYVYSAGITDAFANNLIEKVRSATNRRPNAILALSTVGGSPDAAYRIARCIKRHYAVFTLHVFGACYSAGTLIAIGANEIVMSEFGQLGPLDVQLADKSEFLGQTPGLDVSQALATLSGSAFDIFTSHFFNLSPGRSISTQLAREIAATLTQGIIEPIASQIDPLLLGRVDRSMRIAEAYTTRLNPAFRNIDRLVRGYPSHEFVIDLAEAHEIFGNVRSPQPAESAFENLLRSYQLCPNQHASGYVEQLEVPLPPPPSTAPAHESVQSTVAESGNSEPVPEHPAPSSTIPGIEATNGTAAPATEPAGGIRQRQVEGTASE